MGYVINCNCAILISLIIIIIYYISYSQESFINYNIGDKTFSVLERKPKHENAAHILHSIDKNILILREHFNNKYSYIHKYDNNKKNKLIYNIKNKMNNTYHSKCLTENFPTEMGKDVSYNVNKGENISLCLREYHNPDKFHKTNDILFVALHEIAHSCNDSYGHDPSFWKIFRIILEHAVEIGIYKNNNYRTDNVNYCSMNITYNPIFDSSLDDDNYF